MDTDTRGSGARLFYQVKPSGRRRVLKMVPGQSIQTQTMVNSSVHVLSGPVTRASLAPPSKPSRPLTAPAMTPSHPKPQIQSPVEQFSQTAAPTSPPTTISLGKCLIQVPAPKQMLFIPNKNSAPSNSTAIFKLPTGSNVNLCGCPSKSPAILNPPVAQWSAANILRTFTKVASDAAKSQQELNNQTRQLVLQLPQRPNSPSKWVVEDNGQKSTSQAPLIPPVIASEVLDVVAKREVDCSLLMWNDKMFFKVEKEKPVTDGSVDSCGVSLARKEVDNSVNSKDGVEFVRYFLAKRGSGDEEGAGEKPHPAACRTEGHMRKRKDAQMSSPAPCPLADHKLKQMFGITSEVEIRLHRVVCPDTRRGSASRAPPLDYTEPIEEDFLCDLVSPHSPGCLQVDAAPSRVGRTRKRTKCPCCSPAALFRHRTHKRRPKPGDRRETVRKQLTLTNASIVPNTDVLALPTAPRKLVRLLPAPPTHQPTTTLTSPLTAPFSTTLTSPLSAPFTTTLTSPLTAPFTTTLTAPVTAPVTAPTHPLNTTLTSPLTAPSNALTSTPGTTTAHIPVSTPGSAQMQVLHMPGTVTTLLTSPVTVHTSRLDLDPEELKIHREIQLLREALRLKEAALQKLKKDRNT